jgi:ABC-type lipoprotein release transport system permease subunit
MASLDLPTYGGFTTALVAAVLVASDIPARRAAALSPIETLRAE